MAADKTTHMLPTDGERLARVASNQIGLLNISGALVGYHGRPYMPCERTFHAV